MMQSNLKYSKHEMARRDAYDKSFNHLINPIEFQLMDQEEKRR